MGKGSTSHWILNTCLFAFSSYLLYFYLPSMELVSLMRLLFFAAVFLLFGFLKTYLPTRDSFFLEPVVLMTYLIAHGFSGIWVAAMGTLGFVLLTRQTLRDSMYLFGSTVLSAWGATIVFQVSGGEFGAVLTGTGLISLLGFITMYLICVYGFEAVHISLVTDKPLEILNLIKDDRLTTGLMIITGLISTVLYQAIDLPGFFIMIVLIITIWKILKIYYYSEQKYVKTVETFLNVTENKFPHFRGHSERVTKFCQILLNRLRITREERNAIEYAALLHDIGKLGMPEKLLRIRTYLTNDEVLQLQSHPEIGKKLALQISGMDRVAEIIYSHHEKYNGNGYPHGLAGKEIPFGARVIAIANRLDNLIFRDGLRFEQACSELNSLAGSDLDPELVEIFLQALLNYNKVIPVNSPIEITDRLEANAKDIVEQLRFYLDKSWVLGALQMNYVVFFENGEIRNCAKCSREEVPESLKNYLFGYVDKVLAEKNCIKEFIIDPDSARIFDAYFIPVSENSCLATIFDMTEILNTEREREERELKIYRDVILAVTQGKMLLTVKDEIETYIHPELLHSELRLLDAQDVARGRAMIRAVLETLPMSSQRKTQMVLCVSEAATNVIKHVGEGKIGVYLLEASIRVVIQDNGPGIDVTQLPQVTLRKGYSTKLSLGFGFTIMLDYLDRLIMATKGGTTLVLEMNYNTGQNDPEEIKAGEKKVVQENVC